MATVLYYPGLIGHCALKTEHKYYSFWPDYADWLDKPGIFGTPFMLNTVCSLRFPGHFMSEEDDRNVYPFQEEYEIIDFDEHVIESNFYRIKSADWSLLPRKGTLNCISFVQTLLDYNCRGLENPVKWSTYYSHLYRFFYEGKVINV